MPELRGLMFNLKLKSNDSSSGHWSELWLTTKGLIEKSGWRHVCISTDECMSFDHGEGRIYPTKNIKIKDLGNVVIKYKITLEEVKELISRLKS